MKELTVTRQFTRTSFVLVCVLASVAIFTSCNSEPKPTPTPKAEPPTKPAPTAEAPRLQNTVTTRPGVAGGVAEQSYTAQAIVTAVDLTTRRVTLTDSAGKEYTFTAGPEIKNLPQLRVNDKVTATFARRLVVTVRSADESPSNTHVILSATAPSGEKPGMLAAEHTERVGRVTAIDTVNRTADLEFVDGIVKRVPVRSDVDLSRYNVGDNVVISVTSALKVIAETPEP